MDTSVINVNASILTFQDVPLIGHQFLKMFLIDSQSSEEDRSYNEVIRQKQTSRL